jgi:hypothetical protein
VGTWRKVRAEPVRETLAPPGIGVPAPAPAGGPGATTGATTGIGTAARRRALPAVPARLRAETGAAYAAVALAGAFAGLALAAAILALAGRTLFGVAAASAQVFLVAAPLLGLLPLAVLLLLAAARPGLRPHLLRLLVLWLALAGGTAFWLGVRPFLR